MILLNVKDCVTIGHIWCGVYHLAFLTSIMHFYILIICDKFIAMRLLFQ